MGDLDALALSISKHGQQEPILLRPSKNLSGGGDFEIIFGNRRWRACKLINLPVRAIIKNVSDSEAAICQQEENCNRENISDFSKAVHLKKLIDKGIFSSVKDLSESMGISRTALTDLLSYTRIPERVMSCFQNPSSISKRMASKISSLCSTNNEKIINEIMSIAKKIEVGDISIRQLAKYFDDSAPRAADKEKKDANESSGLKATFSENVSGGLVVTIPIGLVNKIGKQRAIDKIEKCLK